MTWKLPNNLTDPWHMICTEEMVTSEQNTCLPSLSVVMLRFVRVSSTSN